MNSVQLTPEDLLSGAETVFEIVVPDPILSATQTGSGERRIVQLRPLTIGTFQLIMKAAKSDPGLIPLLMIKESLVEPSLSLDQVKRLPLGLIHFLMDQIRQISGLTGKKTLSSI